MCLVQVGDPMDLYLLGAEPEQQKLIKECKICKRQAFGRHYGVMSCYACKMFFRRVHVGKLAYTCKLYDDCFEMNIERPWKCQSCRYKRCLDVGMSYVPLAEIVPIGINDTKINQLEMLLGELKIKDIDRQNNLSFFYSTHDASLEDIVKNPRAVKKIEKEPEYLITPHEWAFLALFSHISYFMSFEFVQQISIQDQKTIFEHCALKLTYFCGLMRTVNERRGKMLSPGGQEIYPADMVSLYKNTGYKIMEICSKPVAKMHEWKVTNEEYWLLNLIFFCNPAIPDISENAKLILTQNQQKYSTALFQYCQLNYQRNAPSRLADLYSLYETITINAKQMEGFFMMFHWNTPVFEFKKLIRDTFHF